MNRLYLLLWLLSAFVNGFSQEIKVTKGSGQVEFLITKSRLEVQNQAKELAVVDALERAFLLYPSGTTCSKSPYR